MELELKIRKLMNLITTISLNSCITPAKLKILLIIGTEMSGVLKGFNFNNNLFSVATITLINFSDGKEEVLDLKEVSEITNL